MLSNRYLKSAKTIMETKKPHCPTLTKCQLFLFDLANSPVTNKKPQPVCSEESLARCHWRRRLRCCVKRQTWETYSSRLALWKYSSRRDPVVLKGTSEWQWFRVFVSILWALLYLRPMFTCVLCHARMYYHSLWTSFFSEHLSRSQW